MVKIKENIILGISGLVIGFLSGLVGVGGGEYRIPVLLYLLKKNAKFAITANLLISLLVVTVSFLKRKGYFLPLNILLISFIFIVFSIFGSYLGAIWTKKHENVFLIRVLGLLLVVVSFNVFLDTGKIFSLNLEISTLSIILSIIFGFLIGILSGFLGIAGGEFRIPVLLLIFGFSIKIAGTANLLISIPTVLTGFIKHNYLGHVDKNSIIISFVMGIFSIIGAFVGAAFIFHIHDHTLFIILSIIMLLAGLKMFFKP